MAGPLWTSPRQYFAFHRAAFFLIVLLSAIFGCGYWHQKIHIHKNKLTKADTTDQSRLQDKPLSKLIYPQPRVFTLNRRNVLELTSWLAPVVWEETFNIDILNEQFRLQNATVGLTVFALKQYKVYLEEFLRSAEIFFMVGHRVNYYIFTDEPHTVPRIPLRKERQVFIFQIRSFEHPRDISMQRMEFISIYSKKLFHSEVAYLVCLDVDVTFHRDVGVEILSPLFATLHLRYYMANQEEFPYERQPESQAYIPEDKGDFYYTGSLFGGSVAEIDRLSTACHQMIVTDKLNNIEPSGHGESYLNKYLFYHKPTKILSLEYMFNWNMVSQRWKDDHLDVFTLIKSVKIENFSPK